ncbi:hypothetical protein Tco_0931195 [Tanacetum coccineum]
MSNSFSALNKEEKEDEEDVENVYDESANLIQNTKAIGSSSFKAAVGNDEVKEEKETRVALAQVWTESRQTKPKPKVYNSFLMSPGTSRIVKYDAVEFANSGYHG